MSNTTKTKLLFIGNSATYVHNVPETLATLATTAGFPTQSIQITKGGYQLCNHADPETDHGQSVYGLIAQGFDVVFLQDNGNCIFDEEKRRASFEACLTLNNEIKKTGAKTQIYVRPPYNYKAYGYAPLEQCVEFDKLFGKIASKIGADCSFVNRAFSYVLQKFDINLYGEDNAHTSPEGAYLIVCIMFTSLYNTSATVLSTNGINPEIAKTLQRVADKISLEGFIPWEA